MDDIIIEEYDEVLHGKDEDIMEDNMKKNKKEKSNKKRKNNKKRLKKLNLYLLIVSIIWIVLIFINTFLIFKYDVLPFKYLIIYLLIIVVLPILLMFLATRKKINKGIKVFISIIGIIYIILLSFAFFYINNTFNFIKDFTSGYSYETKNYLVLVLNDSEFSEIKDLDNEKIGFVNPVNHEIEKLETLDTSMVMPVNNTENQVLESNVVMETESANVNSTPVTP